MTSILKNTLTSVISLGLVLGLSSVGALAQSNDRSDPFDGDADNNEVFSGSGVSLTDLLNNARRADGLTAGEFNAKTDANIEDAAADFRQRQQEAIDAQQGAVDAPVTEEQL